MSSRQVVVVDGSNIATEGRSQPSLVQLDEAVRAYRDEHPDHEIIVVVDATFAHRIDESERAMFEEAAAHNELVYPPAGAVGRGDAFLLRIAEKTSAVVLSNDSFQEFHGEHDWLFEKGRLIGGTPVPGVGWIFVARTPVRGPKSREAVKEARRTRARIGSKDASAPMPVPKTPPPARKRAAKAAGKAASKAAGRAAGKAAAKAAKAGAKAGAGAGAAGAEVGAAIAEATEEAVHPAELNGDAGGPGKGRKRRRKRRGGTAPVDLPTLNEPLTFIEFIAAHKLGSEVEGVVESFASHGAFVQIDDARCYIPLSGMGDPPPRSAREVLRKGESRTFVVQALDAARRGIELALPGFAHVSGTPTEETVEAEIAEAPRMRLTARTRPATSARKGAAKAVKKGGVVKKATPGTAKTATRKATAKKAATRGAARSTGVPPAADPVPAIPEAGRVDPLRGADVVAMETTPVSALASKRAAKKAPMKKKAAATKATTPKVAKKAAVAKKTAPAAKKAAATKAGAKRTTATKAAAAKKASRKAATKAGGGRTAKAGKATGTKKTTATKKTATVKKAAAKKTTATKKTARR
jgi:hypothetical protein